MPDFRLPKLDLSVLDGKPSGEQTISSGRAQTPERLSPELVELAGQAGGIADSLSPGGLGDLIVRGVLSQALGFEIPSAAEVQNTALLNAIARASNEKKLAKLQVSSIFASMLDRADELNAHPSLRSAGVKVDEDLINRPDELVAVSQLIGEPISKGDLFLADITLLTPEQQANQQAEAALKQKKTTEGNIEYTEKLLAREQEFQSGSGPAFDAVKQVRELVETGLDVDLSGGDVDSDEDRGSYDFGVFAKRAVDTIAGLGFDRKLATRMFLQHPELGGDLVADQLEGLQTDEAGRLIVGKGDAGVTDSATFYLTASLLQLAKEAGMQGDEVAQLVGLRGINEESFLRAGVEEAAKKGVTPQALFRDLGLVGTL